MISKVEKEIVELHQFFQDWFNNELADTDENFSRFSNVLEKGFGRIAPDGQVSGREVLLKGLRAAHNSHSDMKIWIKNVQIQFQIGGIVLATYEEWQEIEGQATARLSSVSFKSSPEAPNGLVWLHVHETWIISP